MSYSRSRYTSDGLGRRCSVISWLYGVAFSIWVLGSIGYALFTGIHSWITGAGQYADIVTIKITNTGFEPHSVKLSANQLLHVVNASFHPVVICTGHKQVCSKNVSSDQATPMTKATPTSATTPTAVTMPTGGLTIQPGKSYDLSFKNGNYSFTIMIEVGVVFDATDLGVTVQGGDNSSISSEDDDNGVSVSSGSDDEEDSGSGSGTSSGGSGGGGDDGGGSSGGSGGDGGGGGGGGGGE